MKTLNISEQQNFFVLGALLTISLLLIYYCHFILQIEVIYTHFLYIPIILASLWWSRRGIAVAVFLASIIVISHVISSITTPIWGDLMRGSMFVIVGTIVAILNHKRLLLLDELKSYSESLENRVEKCTNEFRNLQVK